MIFSHRRQDEGLLNLVDNLDPWGDFICYFKPAQTRHEMNPRLLSAGEKQLNRESRARRKYARKVERRRQQIIGQLTCAGNVLSLGTIPLHVGYELALGTLGQARRAVRSLLRHAFLVAGDGAGSKLPAVSLRIDECPTRTARTNGRTLPILSSESPLTIPSKGSQLDAFNLCEKPLLRGRCAIRVLEYVVETTHLSPAAAAQMLYARGLICEPLTDQWLKSFAAGVSFDRAYSFGLRAYVAGVLAGEVRRAEGVWALFEDFAQVVPWVNIPARVRCDLYLARRIEPTEDTNGRLEVFSRRYRPLFNIRLPTPSTVRTLSSPMVTSG